MAQELLAELSVFEANLFPDEEIVVTQLWLNRLQDLPYEALQIKRTEGGEIDGLVLAVFIDHRIEEWLLTSDRATTIYDLPACLIGGLDLRTHIIWLDLVAGVTTAGKLWAVRRAVDLVRRKEREAKIYSRAVTADGRALAIKLGLTEVADTNLFLRKGTDEKN